MMQRLTSNIRQKVVVALFTVRTKKISTLPNVLPGIFTGSFEYRFTLPTDSGVRVFKSCLVFLYIRKAKGTAANRKVEEVLHQFYM